MYQRMAKEAREEGFEELAVKFERVAAVEKAHETRYRKLLERLQNGEVFKEAGAVFWMCRQCGHLHFDINAPEVCPTCGYPKAYLKDKLQTIRIKTLEWYIHFQGLFVWRK